MEGRKLEILFLIEILFLVLFLVERRWIKENGQSLFLLRILTV
jgi:hypothetical protein